MQAIKLDRRGEVDRQYDIYSSYDSSDADA
jgi:hypothetical protein